MKRRDFLGGYSLLVLAGPQAGAPRQDFERIAPTFAPPPEPAREPHMSVVELETDFLVAGGGIAGVSAAVAAARHGAKVVLVQDRSRLGGNSSSEVKMHIVGASCHKSRLPPGMARIRPARGVPPGGCRAESAPLVGTVGPAAL
jgi:hypothetical protein